MVAGYGLGWASHVCWLARKPSMVGAEVTLFVSLLHSRIVLGKKGL